MREIKFRAWDGEKMQFQFVVGRPQSANCLSVMTDEEFAKTTYGLKEWKIMQFTGLKDKNGVDIFEDDILKCDFSKNYSGNYNSIQIVEFYEGAFGSRRKDTDLFRIPALFSGRATEGMNLNYYEVIGNIYQNPELL